jgi:serine/threonine protein kinase
MNPEVGAGTDVLERFLNEAAATASIDHPGVIKTLHVDVSADGRLYQIMEYVDGVTLTSLLALGPLGAAAAARIGAIISAALSAAHALNVVHRDIKAHNIILCTRAPGVKILDFGLSKLLDDASSRASGALTQPGQMCGTPAYMSPEQIRDFASTTPQTDVYSLGVVLHEMATGRLPFASPTSFGYLVAHLTHPPPDLRERAPDAPAALAELVLRCMAKAPEDRPTSAALARELEAIADALGAPLVEAIVEAKAARAVAPTLLQ